MRILFFGINYSPELTGIGKYTTEMAEWLVKEGHEVHMITAMPYYPEWSVHEGYRQKMWFTEKINGVFVRRCTLYVPKEITSTKRIIHEFSFVMSSLPYWVKVFVSKKFDLVFSIASPFHLGILPAIYSTFRKAKFVYHIQDLQVDAAKDLGMINNRVLQNLMFAFEYWIMKKSNIVSSISEGMLNRIWKKGIRKDKLWLLPNGIDTEKIYPMHKEYSLRSALGIDLQSKVILYSGNLGEKQGLEIIIDLAKEYIDRKNVVFLICGDGGAKQRLIKLAKESALNNILFIPLQPIEKLNALLASADVHLVLQKKSAGDLVLPSKLGGILAAGGCAVVTADSNTSLYEMIHNNNAGILVEPESLQALKQGVKQALNSEMAYVGINARKYAEKKLSKDCAMSELNKMLMRL